MQAWVEQRDYDVRFEWGPRGAETLAGATVVVVDVLRFTTAVDAAVSRGAAVFPYRAQDATAGTFARQVGADLADGTDGLSLSPLSLLGLTAGDRVVLPSPNGSTCAALADEAGAQVAAACLRNASAVAAWAAGRGQVTVVAGGERWPDGSLRPALEDHLGAGAVIAGLGGTWSPEARAAVAAWRDAAADIGVLLAECASGRECAERGWADDVVFAGRLDVSDTVPVLRDGAFVAADG